MLWKWRSFSHVQLFATPWTIQSPGQNTRVGSLSFLQGIFPTQGSNPHLLHLPALASGFFITSATWEAHIALHSNILMVTGVQTCALPISFSNAWKWKVKVKSLSRVQLLGTPWTAAYQAPPSMGFSRQEYWSGVQLPFPYYCLRFV